MHSRTTKSSTALRYLSASRRTRSDHPSITEASRCYLYGFFRGTVLLSASAVETTLRRVLSPTAIERIDARLPGAFKRLVDESISAHLLGESRRIGEEPVLATYSRLLFDTRNRVAHGGYDPQMTAAEEMLHKGREIVEFVRQHQS